MSPLPPTGFRRLGPDKTGRNSCIPVFCLRADRGGQRMNFRIIRRAPCAILTCIAIYESLQRPMKVETEIAAGFFGSTDLISTEAGICVLYGVT